MHWMLPAAEAAGGASGGDASAARLAGTRAGHYAPGEQRSGYADNMESDELCCPSSYSRQRAVVMTNRVPLVLDAIETAWAQLPPDPPLRTLESLLVQLEQVVQRMHCVPGTPDRAEEVAGALRAGRRALTHGDGSLAASLIEDALASLQGEAKGP